MEEANIIRVDLAKNVFQLHGVADGAIVFRKKLSRLQFARFMADRAALTGLTRVRTRSHAYFQIPEAR